MPRRHHRIKLPRGASKSFETEPALVDFRGLPTGQAASYPLLAGRASEVAQLKRNRLHTDGSGIRENSFRFNMLRSRKVPECLMDHGGIEAWHAACYMMQVRRKPDGGFQSRRCRKDGVAA